jgi:hypothetical protein
VKGSRFELLPGSHTLRFTAYRRLPNELIAGELSAECRVTLELAAGRVYETRAEFDRESLGTAKAPGGVVTRQHLRLAVLDEGSEIERARLECSDRNACMVFWRHGSAVSSATCARYEQPGFAFRGQDDRKRTFRNGVEGELLAGYGTYCSDLDDAATAPRSCSYRRILLPSLWRSAMRQWPRVRGRSSSTRCVRV